MRGIRKGEERRSIKVIGLRGIRKGEGGLKGDRIERYKERRRKEDWKAKGLRGIRKREERRTGRR